MYLFVVVCLAYFATSATHANVFLHNPRGSNNRGCERSDNTRNQARLFDSENDSNGGYACPYAWPFACYTIPVEADREACNRWNADQNYDDISTLNMMDDEGILHPRGTRTNRMYFFTGSQLSLEWTARHGCGDNPRVRCDFVIQYACEDTLADDCGVPAEGKTCNPRDGHPLNNYQTNDRGAASYAALNGLVGGSSISRQERDQEMTPTIPTSNTHRAQSDPRFGRHEGINYYIKCRRTERNKGLWIADRGVRGDALGTRQNNGGGRHGLECPEERDYYPYWRPSPWRDIAILTDRHADCPSIVAESQNVKEKYECVCSACTNILLPITKEGCAAVSGEWVAVQSHGMSAPYCGPAPSLRENHLGNPIGGGKNAATYNWTIPNTPNKVCVLRIRYNITSLDPISKTDSRPATVYADFQNNANNLNQKNSPLTDSYDNELLAYQGMREHKDVYPAAQLGYSYRTFAMGKTYQDRSWSFEIRDKVNGGECSIHSVYNLNVRGKRGNIVQTFPAVEYDFTPSEMYVTDKDCLHIQWTGSDYNPARNDNDAYGGPPDPNDLNDGRADRHNIVQIYGSRDYQPVMSLDYDYTMFNIDRDRKMYLAFLGQPISDTNICWPIERILALSAEAQQSENVGPRNPLFYDNNENFLNNNNDRDRYYKNCGKLSGVRTPYFDAGLIPMSHPGSFAFMSTRTNSFSNRNEVGIIHVQSVLLTTGSIAGVLFGGALFLGFLAAGIIACRRKRQRQREMEAVTRMMGTTPGLAGAAFGRRESPPGGIKISDSSSDSGGVAASRRPRPGQAGLSAPIAAPMATSGNSATVIALYNHQAAEAGELAFRKGDVITVIRKDESGWWEGRSADGKKGIFPANYVQANV